MNLAAQATPLIAALERLGPHDHPARYTRALKIITRSLFHSYESGSIVEKNAFT